MRTLFLVFVLCGAALSAGTMALPRDTDDDTADSSHRHGNVRPRHEQVRPTVVARQRTQCGRLHADILGLSHPVDFTPDRALPLRYRLDAQGLFTCGTCHESHDSREGRDGITETRTTMCPACHDRAFFETMPDAGSSLRGLAHLRTASAGSESAPDSLSNGCLACHESPGDGARWHGPPLISGSVGLGNAGHPVGVLYSNARAFGGYRPVSLLPPEITLPGGLVSCVSCHQGYSRRHGALVMSNRGSALCLGCHDI